MNAGSPRGGNLALATGGALGVALLVLFTLVLPAEYGVDPLGTGAALGLLGLAEKDSHVVTESADHPLASDHVTFELAPFESVEYKYRLATDAGLVFSWHASAPVTVDFHAEPDGGPEGYAESFRRGSQLRDRGTYTAPFSGIHGWFWENRGMVPVTVELRSAGFFVVASEFRDGRRVDRGISATSSEQ